MLFSLKLKCSCIGIYFVALAVSQQYGCCDLHLFGYVSVKIHILNSKVYRLTRITAPCVPCQIGLHAFYAVCIFAISRPGDVSSQNRICNILVMPFADYVQSQVESIRVKQYVCVVKLYREIRVSLDKRPIRCIDTWGCVCAC